MNKYHKLLFRIEMLDKINHLGFTDYCPIGFTIWEEPAINSTGTTVNSSNIGQKWWSIKAKDKRKTKLNNLISMSML